MQGEAELAEFAGVQRFAGNRTVIQGKGGGPGAPSQLGHGVSSQRSLRSHRRTECESHSGEPLDEAREAGGPGGTCDLHRGAQSPLSGLPVPERPHLLTPGLLCSRTIHGSPAPPAQPTFPCLASSRLKLQLQTTPWSLIPAFFSSSVPSSRRLRFPCYLSLLCSQNTQLMSSCGACFSLTTSP